ncbi:NAD-dependent epimerase/dehydratase family protein [Solitalea canadensis]|uniref:Nucleoside-diphosphate-sugar epimerase n=1 Tax=Solitalea canadensis (strain ATCC 29591 / DSM 3403 / JCM 21819 / LMG 8368 / NBRC 15130 / NCIMB 12057 / USAM 9D) TaxID=929556 RepID=H8KPA0_SOLCM|nr:NAD-dependent epimerase/dehydratase family protein [Solitalea canadensis]AFD05737.1 nucleoside-diphosphate-sugar epimerase [Solitalea canadensis DSM 3403]
MKILVTGANGHLGNNIVRYLLNENIQVFSGVRAGADVSMLTTLSTEIVTLDYKSVKQLSEIFSQGDVVIHTAAVFKRWARNAQKEIIDQNVNLSENIVNAAADAGIKKLIYISSLAALDDTQQPMDETSWNQLKQRPYSYSKSLSEQKAIQIAKERGLTISTLLPSAIIGENFNGLTPTLKIFADIVNNKLPMIPHFNFLFINVKDVARAAFLAIEYARDGERYIISDTCKYSIEQVFELAQRSFPQLKLKKPSIAPKPMLYFMACLGENISKITGKEPLLTVEDLNELWNASPQVNVSKAKRELGFEASAVEAGMLETFKFLNPALR